MVKYFFDSYAIVEMVKGNPNYSKYLGETTVITIFNLAEIYWAVLKDFGEKKSNEVHSEIKPFVREVDDETLKHAMKFRRKQKRRRLSYADCIGYIYALRNKLHFLTGDKEFKNMKGVEFVC
ncbi:MAG: PIN domain-containing protein [Deltaproteobacteria bacterium]|nr:PIN domain-containing protein [Deltaproteobacteria bacterium]